MKTISSVILLAFLSVGATAFAQDTTQNTDTKKVETKTKHKRKHHKDGATTTDTTTTTTKDQKSTQ